MTLKLCAAFILSLLFAVAFGKVYIPWLRKIKAGQSIKEIGPNWHMSKQGTPTMGGLLFIGGAALACLTVGFVSMLRGRWVHIGILGFATVFGAIGFLDDWEKLRHHENTGLTAGKKFLLQLAAALVFILLMRYIGVTTPNLYVPFTGETLPLPEWLYISFAAFVIVGTVNAVNITDGIDGLAASVTVPVGIFFAVVAVWRPSLGQFGIYAAALVGALLGFLVYNFHPAKVFMGDTGSLFLGGTVAALAFAYDMPLILIPTGFVYICETMSDILQVGYFKLTHGKRLFKMAPLHHHFEMCGWSEVKLVAVFTSVSVLGCVLAALGVLGRYRI